jgi:hypothetical protein
MRVLKTVLSLTLIFLVTGQELGSAQTAQTSWDKKSYHTLMDGNELFSLCSEAEKDIHIGPQGHIEIASVPAAQCWAYVEAVVDSIPDGEGFAPARGVRLSQYVDVVRIYLKNHPEQRHLPAHHLSRWALTDAFPAEK